ncbi:hypothetical protein UPYG_G00132230 [Umbra pygmaea]|uniref:Uncharacterized protein n=1 Tax=Umbra pygmaea TaxID=75934 RepID=A0ABD0WY00_UMBPY
MGHTFVNQLKMDPDDQSGTNESSGQPEESSKSENHEGQMEDGSRTSPNPESDAVENATAVDMSDSKGVSSSKPRPPCTRKFETDLSDFERDTDSPRTLDRRSSVITGGTTLSFTAPADPLDRQCSSTRSLFLLDWQRVTQQLFVL